jgi:tetratricopeptide (TPR) repeat protein
MRNIGLLFAFALSGCFGQNSVTRVVDGQAREGRAIDESAYAAYLRAALEQQAGKREQALEELDRALDSDALSPEILTRIGELRCGTTQASGAVSAKATRAALGAFSRALGLDGSYAPAWLGRARCLERSGRRAEALVAAERAAYFDPLRVESTTTVARLLFAAGRDDEAWAWLDALVLLEPSSIDAERARLAAAERQRSAFRRDRSRQRLAALGRPVAAAERAALERALARGDLASARAHALALGISGAELALLACESAPELAFEQALFVLRADPSEASAWVAALVAADRLADEQRFAEALDELDAEPLPASRGALELLGELIARRAGPDAARVFRGAEAVVRH